MFNKLILEKKQTRRRPAQYFGFVFLQILDFRDSVCGPHAQNSSHTHFVKFTMRFLTYGRSLRHLSRNAFIDNLWCESFNTIALCDTSREIRSLMNLLRESFNTSALCDTSRELRALSHTILQCRKNTLYVTFCATTAAKALYT